MYGKRTLENPQTLLITGFVRVVAIITYGHSCASLLLNNGFALKDVQEWMGHSDIEVTANIYGHIDTARKQGMADMLSGRLAEVC